MNDSIRLAALAAALVLGAGAVDARDHGPGDPAEMFERADLDGNGEVTLEEFEEARTQRFARADADGDGKVTEAEFVAHARAEAEERAREMFARLDADGDGALTKDTLAAMQGTAHGGGERMLRHLDADGNGAVSREEFDLALERFQDHRGWRHKRWDR